MQTYKIEVREILSQVVEIKANTLDEAIQKAEDRYENQDIVLDSGDYADVEFVEFK